jgi:hypothetical protein
MPGWRTVLDAIPVYAGKCRQSFFAPVKLEGFVITAVGRIPKKAETFDWNGWRFEVVDMDKNRVDEIFARPIGANVPSD